MQATNDTYTHTEGDWENSVAKQWKLKNFAKMIKSRKWKCISPANLVVNVVKNTLTEIDGGEENSKSQTKKRNKRKPQWKYVVIAVYYLNWQRRKKKLVCVRGGNSFFM